MVDNKDLEAEIHPLKNDDRQSQENLQSRSDKEDPCKSPPPRSRLSRCRTVAFFVSLFICLLVVFVVSFIVPCPDRPASQRTWRIDYNTAVAYNFLAMEDVNRDRIQDILFLYKTANSSNSNRSCADEGFSSPCAFAAAVSGANGSLLWERPVAQDVTLVQCTSPQQRDSGVLSACILVEGSGLVIALDPFTGEALWSHPSSLGGNTSILSLLLGLPDVDSDGLPDLLVLTREDKEMSCYLYSGGTGSQVGSKGRLGTDGEKDVLLHVTRTGAHYLLFPCARSLCGWSLKSLLEGMTGRESHLQRDLIWERTINTTTYRLVCARLLYHSPRAIRYQMLVPGRAGEDLLLVGSEACMLLDGQDLVPRWILGDTQVFRKPILGHYKPDTLAVVIENGTGINRQVLLLGLETGAILWHQPLPDLPRGPPSASVLTADHRSAFFFWGLPEGVGTNQMDTPRSLYMFHPTLPGVLLELANVSVNIIAFQAVLLEPSRHAAYILLTGPENPAAPGLVSVTKHKVRDSILDSRVVYLGRDRDNSDQAVRDHFFRLRYRSES
ncbi:PREDICTED: protein ITFG3 [Chrysochloris asiatica]|uniref:Protein ITFG3 n=1 Tax=Chrysochloris asiatica TaxID=185453 RepID=A0A9B0U7M7_CHRAS|nr:PREDICTED: protein ITFG3 [Chrysochloris asiatica]